MDKSVFELIEGKSFEEVKVLLESDPYNIKIDESDKYYLLKYNMINSDMDSLAVNQSRGIIFEKGSNDVVCYPFNKFYNYGEGGADVIDWKTARVQEKLDGSIIKVWYHDDKWRVSTNGKIDAFEAELASNLIFKNFGELFKSIIPDLSIFDEFKEYTLMFELMSMYNRVIVPHEIAHVKHIGSRNNTTFEEVDIDIGIEKPLSFNMKTIQDVVNIAATLPYDEEGYVIVDGAWCRNKVKGPAYLAVHNIRGDGVIREKSMLQLIRTNDHHEFLSYFPEYKDVFNKMSHKYQVWVKRLKLSRDDAFDRRSLIRKDYAMWALKQADSAYLFKFFGDVHFSVDDYLKTVRTEKLLEKLNNI